MMTVECAVSIGLRRCRALYAAIEAWEAKKGALNMTLRGEVGAWRCLLYEVGMARDQLPETPFIDPERKAETERRTNEAKAQAQARKRKLEAVLPNWTTRVRKLEEAGFKVGTVNEFLGLDDKMDVELQDEKI